MADQPKTLENLLTEDRLFPPTDEFAAAANVGPEVYEKADADYLAFWKEQALNRVSWFKEPIVVLDAPLIIEGELERQVDVLVYVESPDSLRRARARSTARRTPAG